MFYLDKAKKEPVMGLVLSVFTVSGNDDRVINALDRVLFLQCDRDISNSLFTNFDRYLRWADYVDL